jgi:hypothetical protein
MLISSRTRCSGWHLHGGSVEKDERRETGPLLAIGRVTVLRFMSKTGWEISSAGIYRGPNQ